MPLALEQAGGKAGNFTIKYTSLDDSTAQAGKWDAGPDAANARKAAQDKSADRLPRRVQLGRVGGLDPDPQRGRHPADLARRTRRVGLTTSEPGRRPGRAGQVLPDRQAHLHAHRPEGHDPGRRARDVHEGGRLHEGRTSLNDKEVYGAGLATNIEVAAKAAGPQRSSATTAIDKARQLPLAGLEDQGRRRRLLRVLRGITANNAVAALQGLRARRCPNAKLYGPDGVAESGFTDPKEGGIPASVRRTRSSARSRRCRPGRVPAGRPEVLQGLRGRSTASRQPPIRTRSTATRR